MSVTDAADNEMNLPAAAATGDEDADEQDTDES